MAILRLDNLYSIRSHLDKSQREFAAMLGVSTRAIQSYEQGWRCTPDHVLCKAVFMLYIVRRRKAPKMRPCWEIVGCTPEQLKDCQAYVLDAGDVCWLVTGTTCDHKIHKTWRSKISHCNKCPVLLQWLEKDECGKPAGKPRTAKVPHG
jgi:DNA-binding XRE family transcriptional regulator